MDVAAIFFTPFSVQNNLMDQILKDISCNISFSIFFRKFVRLNIEDVCILYPTLIDNPVFPMIVECLTTGNCELVIIKGESLYPTIKEIKGKFRCECGQAIATGLRLKYKKDEKSFEFIFHITDYNYEVDEIKKRFFV